MGSNSDDLVERLRARLEAADEIECLRAQVGEQAAQLEQAEAKLTRVREAARRLLDEEGGPA
jgi:multidrug resistance efflux pump